MIKNKRILLTGGAGFIGSKLSSLLVNENRLMLYDNLRRNSIKDTDIYQHLNVTMIQGDILDYSSLKNAIDDFKPNIVIHLAAIAGIDSVIKNPVETMKVNMLGTYNILEAIKESRLELDCFVDFSTSEVFGSYAYKVDENSTTNLAPVGEARWTYSVSKLAGEHLTYSYFKEYNIPSLSIRPFNIYGPGQVGEGAIHQFIQKAIKNECMEIHGDGSQIRSWCYIDDFVYGVLLCIENEQAIGHSFNLGNPKGSVTISMLAHMIKTLANSSSNIVYVPKNYVDVELRIPSIDKAINMLGFNPKVDLEEGIKRTIMWYRSKLYD